VSQLHSMGWDQRQRICELEPSPPTEMWTTNTYDFWLFLAYHQAWQQGRKPIGFESGHRSCSVLVKLLWTQASTTWAMSPALSALIIFQIGSLFLLRSASDLEPTYASCIVGIPGLCHHAWFISEMCSLHDLASNTDFSNLCLLSSWDYRRELLYLAFSLLKHNRTCTIGMTGTLKELP
jgi:hypothetical protein